eukprot:8896411-Ditylum_brightwellii.AAC.1
MLQHNIQPDAVTFSILLHAYVKSNHPQAPHKAMALLHQMHRSNIQPDLIFFSTLIAAWAKSSHPNSAKQAKSLLHTMEHHYNITVNVQTYNAVLLALA